MVGSIDTDSMLCMAWSSTVRSSALPVDSSTSARTCRLSTKPRLLDGTWSSAATAPAVSPRIARTRAMPNEAGATYVASVWAQVS